MDSHVNYVFCFISQFGGITEGDYIIVLYAHGMAALETGNPHVRHEQKLWFYKICLYINIMAGVVFAKQFAIC